MQKMILAPIEQHNHMKEGYEKTVGILMDELMQMSEEEFGMFLDCIDWKSNAKLAKFAVWINNNRKYIIS